MKSSVVKILSYNIHKGFNATNKQFTLDLIKNSIRNVKADIVFLQEIVGQNELHAMKIAEWPTQSQFEFLADEIWPHYAYGKNAVYKNDKGHHGNAILSVFPIIKWSNYNISTFKLENRGLLHALIEMPFSKTIIHCYCVHLSLISSGRKTQIDRIISIISKEVKKNQLLILAGDFNDWEQVATDKLSENLGIYEVFKSEKGAHALTFPAFMPLLSLDRIYARGFSVKHTQIIKDNNQGQYLSDHLALYAELIAD